MQPVVTGQLRQIVDLPAEVRRVVEVKRVAGDTLFIQAHHSNRGSLRRLGSKIKVHVRFEDVLAQLATESVS